MTGLRLLIDTSKCIGCRACQVACQQWHSLPAEDTVFTGTYQNPPDKSAANLTVTKFFEIVDTKLNWAFFKDQCRHCDDPPCMEECPLRAISKQADGIVRIDPAKCDPSRCSRRGVKPCQDECEFDEVPRYTYVQGGRVVATKMRKCDLCYDRFTYNWDEQRKRPACLGACPPGAISLGGADRILTEARNRVAYLKGHGWPDANIYPSQSDEGTHVIWVLTKNKRQYGGLED